MRGRYSLIALAICATTAWAQPDPQTLVLESFIQSHVDLVRPLSEQSWNAYWQGATTGRPEAFELRKQADLRISRIYSDANAFALLKGLRDGGTIQDPVLKRQLDKLYFLYLPRQTAPDLLARIVTLDTQVQEAYNNYRARMGDQTVTMSDIYTILTTDKDCARREQAWRASKQVGGVIRDDFLALVRLRNESARALGYENYHSLSIAAYEQDKAEVDRIFKELDRLTEKPFTEMKAELDGLLARGYGIEPSQLRPWHYHDPFFQRTPLVYELDLDAYYKGRDIKDLIQRYYAGVGLPVDDIIARSDLYDREGKYPHAFSHEADREGDVRVLANLQDTERWAETALHEFGHAVYSKYHDRAKLPWLLREPAHSFTTEAAAMFFGRLSRNADWMQCMLGLTDEQRNEVAKVSGRYLRAQQILFARWSLVMYEFEKQLYANPDQDLDTLWWDLVERYQQIHRPERLERAGWLSKLHFATAPCYYHNYLLGELLASQWDHTLVTQVLGRTSNEGLGWCNDQRIGQYFKTRVFGPGALYPWEEMIRRSTGEPLTPKYFVTQFIHSPQ